MKFLNITRNISKFALKCIFFQICSIKQFTDHCVYLNKLILEKSAVEMNGIAERLVFK